MKVNEEWYESLIRKKETHGDDSTTNLYFKKIVYLSLKQIIPWKQVASFKSLN